MADLTEEGQSIEGKCIKGQSRDPIRGKGLYPQLRGGQRVYRFDIKFNVKASITAVIDGSPTIEPEASTNPEDRIVCENAMALSVVCKIPKQKVRRGSATHQANFWSFPDQTAVRIVRSHPEIQNAVAKRKESGS